MMNKTQVINYGLIALGQRPLLNPDQLDSEEARIMSALYGIILDETISKAEWPCFMKTSNSLDLIAEYESSKWQYEYKLPVDMNRAISIVVDGYEDRMINGEPYSRNQEIRWNIERNMFYCNLNPVQIKYLVNPPDEEVFPAYFGRPFGMALAYRCSMRIGHDQQYQAKLYEMSKVELIEGQAVALEGSTGRPNETNDWSMIR